MRLVLVLVCVVVGGAPDPGIWSFPGIQELTSYTGVVKNMYANTSMYINVDCSVTGRENPKVRIGWMLRKTPCWEEYLSLNLENNLIYKNYYDRPGDGISEYYANAAQNYTVHFVRPDPIEYNCDSSIIIQPFAELPPLQNTEALPTPQPNLKHNLKRQVIPASHHNPGHDVSGDSPQYVITHDGVYLLVVYISLVDSNLGEQMNPEEQEFNTDLQVRFLSPTAGYLSLTDWPLLPFYGLMCGVYVLLGLLWLIFCSIHWRDILRLQFWIGGVIFLGMVEKAMFTSEYQNINNSGTATQGLIISAELVSTLKRTLARMLVIIVSLGYGIVKPRLGPTLNRVVATGGIYCILASVESVTRVLYPKNDPSNITLLSAVPLAIIDASICWWVFSALIQTTRALRLRRNLVKLSVYKHFTNVLAFAVLASIIFMCWSIKYHKVVECLTDWRDLWVDEAFWHLLFSVILLAIMVLWRPSQNNQRYAFTPLLDGDDDYSSDEDILYNDAWEGMKMRGKQGSRPDTPSGVDPEIDPLAWVEENIAGVEPALPALDSEEEIENTKLEISKLM
jgi:hypothetical protein